MGPKIQSPSLRRQSTQTTGRPTGSMGNSTSRRPRPTSFHGLPWQGFTPFQLEPAGCAGAALSLFTLILMSCSADALFALLSAVFIVAPSTVTAALGLQMVLSSLLCALLMALIAGASHSFRFATARPRLSVLFCLVLCFGMANAMEDTEIPVVNVLPTAVGTLSSTTVSVGWVRAVMNTTTRARFNLEPAASKLEESVRKLREDCGYEEVSELPSSEDVFEWSQNGSMGFLQPVIRTAIRKQVIQNEQSAKRPRLDSEDTNAALDPNRNVLSMSGGGSTALSSDQIAPNLPAEQPTHQSHPTAPDLPGSESTQQSNLNTTTPVRPTTEAPTAEHSQTTQPPSSEPTSSEPLSDWNSKYVRPKTDRVYGRMEDQA